MADDRIWLTYSDAADRLGISVDSVRRRARKEVWAKRKNNAGKMTIAVPIEAGHMSGQEAGQETGHASGQLVHELQKRVAVLEVELSAERQMKETAMQDRDAWKEQAQRLARPWWKILSA